ncbi:hypothetical protein B0I35DRAFT_411152 [Stachybotrys elegans]|uniref:F-box domain-containing protein n=1 Tax=Stachybotrys elegans TaxID=80388 RepID=A0A8K0SKT8_9HYPO|nr:hypothetical protein B0I35DRAFT_411152 [Stachybotrys elegans]
MSGSLVLVTGPGADHPSLAVDSQAKTGLMSLPPELHVAISQHLIYPDALALKLTNRHFYSLVFTGIPLKVAWLVERRSLQLQCPNDRRCDLRSDMKFCKGTVSLMIRRRRQHLECESRPGLGCLIHGTAACPIRRKTRAYRWSNWLQKQPKVELWWVVLSLIPLLLCWCAML